MEARWEGPRPGATWPPGRIPPCAGPGAEPGDSFHPGAASHRGSPVASSASCRLAVTVPLHVRQKRSASLAEGSSSHHAHGACACASTTRLTFEMCAGGMPGYRGSTEIRDGGCQLEAWKVPEGSGWQHSASHTSDPSHQRVISSSHVHNSVLHTSAPLQRAWRVLSLQATKEC